MSSAIETSYVETFRQLAITEGLTLGGLEHGRRAQLIVFTAAATLAFTVGEAYSEREVNARLNEWLRATGAMVAVDHVALRRCLVDCRLLERDGFGRRYARAAAPADWSAALAALEGVDLAGEAQAARAAHTQRRADRKLQWEHRHRASIAAQ